MDEDSKGQRKMKDSGGGLLPAVEGNGLEQNRIEATAADKIVYNFIFRGGRLQDGRWKEGGRLERGRA